MNSMEHAVLGRHSDLLQLNELKLLEIGAALIESPGWK